MRIDGLGTPNLPIAPAPGAGRTANAQPINTAISAAAQALQQEEQKGGGGGGHGHAKKVALDPIEQIAARASLNIEDRKRTMLERMREIEKLKAEMEAEAEKVGEKDPGTSDERNPHDEPEENDDEQASS